MRFAWLSSCLITLVLLGGRAFADEDARALFQKANSHFAVGEFDRAAELYEEAYKLKPDPALLFNAAQALRLAGKSEHALLLYKNYVMFYPQQKNIPLVKQQIQNLQKAIAVQDSARTAPPIGTEPPSTGQPHEQQHAAAEKPSIASTPPQETPPPVTTPPPAQQPPPATATVTPPPSTTTTAAATPAASGSERTPLYKKWWLWTAVAGGVVVITGVALAVAFTTSSGSWQTAPSFGPGVHTAGLVLTW